MLRKRKRLGSRRRLTSLAALVPIGALLTTLVMASPASADTYYHYQSGVPGNYCLDDYNNSQFWSGSLVDAYPCNGTPAQSWVTSSNGPYLQVAFNQNYCLDVYQGGTANGSLVQVYPCNGGANQEWYTGPGNSIVSASSGKCLDIPRGTVTNPGQAPTQLIIWDCNGGWNQQWTR